MSKFWILGVLSAMFIMGVAAHAGEIVYVNNRPMMPLRALGETFGASISYSNRNGIQIGLNYRTATIVPGSRQVWFGRQREYLNDDVTYINGAVYVPVNLINQFGFSWRRDNRDRIIVMQPRGRHQVVFQPDRDWNRQDDSCCDKHDKDCDRDHDRNDRDKGHGRGR
jgi:hypothetical protein